MFAEAPNPLEEVQDHVTRWVFFHEFHKEWHLPHVELFGYDFQITKFMVLELVAALLVILVYVPLARRIRSGGLPTGRYWNFFEGLLLFVRDQIVRPNLDGHGDDHGHGHGDAHGGHGHAHAADSHGAAHGGHAHAAEAPAHKAEVHQGDKYLPFLWTLFLFILFCNLLGMLPLMGSPTASIWVTAGLAVCSFLMIHGAAIAKHGPIHYLKGFWIPIDVPVLGVVFSLIIFVIEFMGTLIKSCVLALRLFANMFAGHLVLANFLLFIYIVGNAVGLNLIWGGVTVASVSAVVGLSILELFVAFLQAYVFTFLTALFMGMTLNPEH